MAETKVRALCTKCGANIERMRVLKVMECFDCKVRRWQQAHLRRYERRKTLNLK